MPEFLGQFESPPALLLSLVERGLVNLEPWVILQTADSICAMEGLGTRYDKSYRPFARRYDNDDIACIDEDGQSVVVVHDYASAGSQERERFASVEAWLHSAIRLMLEFDSL